MLLVAIPITILYVLSFFKSFNIGTVPSYALGKWVRLLTEGLKKENDQPSP